MAITIDSAFVQQFKDNVVHLAQQSDTRLRPTVREEPLTGEALNIDRLGQTDSIEKTAARVATPFVDSPWSRRVATPKTFHWADTFEQEDKVKMLIDPQNAYAQNCGMSMRRAIDDLLIASARADALDGDGVAVPLPGANTLGGATQKLDYSNVLEMQDFLHSGDVDPDDERCWVLSPSAVKELLNDDKIINSDYQKLNMLLTNGVVSSIFGGKAILSNRLESAGAGRTYNMCYTMDALCLGVNQDMMFRVNERDDLSYLIQVYAAWTMAATRVEDEKIVFFDHDDA